MGKCPYCAEEIQDEAIKCKHCGTVLNETKRYKSLPPDIRHGIIIGGLIFLFLGIGSFIWDNRFWGAALISVGILFIPYADHVIRKKQGKFSILDTIIFVLLAIFMLVAGLRASIFLLVAGLKM